MRSSPPRRLHSRVRRRRHPGYKRELTTTDGFPERRSGDFYGDAPPHAAGDNLYGSLSLFLSLSLLRSLHKWWIRSWLRTIIGPGTHIGA